MSIKAVVVRKFVKEVLLNDELIADDCAKANLFNECFHSALLFEGEI